MSRATLLAYADANFDANGIGGITGLELHDFAEAIATEAPIKGEAGDLSGGLTWAAGVLTIADAALSIGKTSGLQTALDAKLASASYTAADVLAKLLTVDGPASGLNADLLDTQSGAFYLDLVNATGSLALARIADGLITLAKIDDQAQGTFLGRGPAAGTGPPAVLSAAAAKVILDTEDWVAPQTIALTTVGTAALTLSTTEASASAGPTLDFDRISPSPAANDLLAHTKYMGRSSTAVQRIFADTYVHALDVTNAAEDGRQFFRAMIGGALSNVLQLGPGVVVGSPTGNDKGANTLNVTTLHEAGVALSAKYLEIADYTAADVLAKLLSVDGVGSGIDSDLLDGQSSAFYLDLANATGNLSNARLVGAYNNFTSITMSDDIFMSSGAALIRNTTVDGSDDRSVRITGAGSVGNTRGAFLSLYGNEAASDPGDFILSAGITAATSFILGGGAAAADLTIRMATADAADTARVQISAGGDIASTRGSYIQLYGNEHASQPGNLLLVAGSTGSIKLNGTAISAFATSTDLANASGTLAIARIADGSVTLAKLASIANLTFLGNNSGGSAAPLALTVAQTKAALAIKTEDVSVTSTNLTTDYTFVLTDAGKWFRHGSVTPHAWTVPPNSSVAYALGAMITMFVPTGGFATITVTPGAGVSFISNGVSVGAFTLLAGQNASMFKVDTDTWNIVSQQVLADLRILGNTSGAASVAKALQATDVYTMLSLAATNYTPTFTNGANVTSTAAATGFYLRLGSTIIVFGSGTVDPIATASTVIDISLPVASNLAAGTDLLGIMWGPAVSMGGASPTILANTTNDRAVATFTTGVTVSTAFYFAFAYRVL